MSERRTATVEEAAKLLGVGRTAAYDAARRGELPTIAVGRRRIVPVRKLEALLGLEPGELDELLNANGAGVEPAPQREHDDEPKDTHKGRRVRPD